MGYKKIEDLVSKVYSLQSYFENLGDFGDIDTFIRLKDIILEALSSSGIQIDEELRDKINTAYSSRYYDLETFCNEIGFKIIDNIKKSDLFYRNLGQFPECRDLVVFLKNIEYYVDSTSDFLKDINLNKNAINSSFNLLEDGEKNDFLRELWQWNTVDSLSMHVFNVIDDYEAKRQFIKSGYLVPIDLDVFYQDEKLQSTVLLKQLSRSNHFRNDIERIFNNNSGLSITLSVDEMNEYVNGLKSAIDEERRGYGYSSRDTFELKKKAFSIISSESKIKYLKDNLEKFTGPLDEFRISELEDFILTYGSIAATLTDSDLEQIRIRQIFKSKIRSIF